MSTTVTTQSFRSTLTSGSVGRHLFGLTVPMIWGILAMLLFNLVDTFFVAQLGTQQLAAVSFTFPVTFVLISLAIGLGAGTSSAIARAIGQNNRGRVRRLASDGMALALVLVTLVSALGIATIGPLFRLLGAEESLIPLIRQYMQIWYGGVVFLIVPMVGMAALRASGDSKTPGVVIASSAVLNAVLDPLLIFGLGGLPRLELRGAAIATVIARAMTLVVTLWVLHFRKRMLTKERPTLEQVKASIRSILHVGLPATGTNIIIPVSMAVVTAMVARHGSEAVAGFGVASRVEAVSLVVFYAMSSIIGPFVGQNLGAGKVDRIAQAVRLSFRFCIAFGALLAVGLAIAARPLTQVFDSDPMVVGIASLYLYLVPLSYGTAGVVMVVNAAFNGMGRPAPAMMISITRMVFVYLPAAYLGSVLFGVKGIFGAAVVANLSAGIGAYLYIRRCVALGHVRV